MNSQTSPRFNRLEIIVLIVIVAILATVLFIGFTRIRGPHSRSVDGHNIRQIGQAALIYANDNRGHLPGLRLDQNGRISDLHTTPNIHAIAAALARMGGLNDAQFWFSARDELAPENLASIATVLDASRESIHSDFYGIPLSYQFVAGLTLESPASTPIAFTRGLQADGHWAASKRVSVYGDNGGHIVFLAGNVDYRRDLQGDNRLLAYRSEDRTSNILEAIPPETRIYSHPATGAGAISGMPAAPRL